MKKLLELLRKLLGGSSSSSDSSSSSGFTLVELLIVIAILGILASGLLLAINPAEKLRQGTDARVLNNVASTANAIEQWTLQTGQGNVVGTYPTALDANSVPKPLEPNDNYTFVYAVDTTNNYFVFGVHGLQSSTHKGKLSGAAGPANAFIYNSQQGQSCYKKLTASSNIISSLKCP